MDGIEIKIARIRAGLKQYELAQRAGIREPELSMIETGRREPSPEKAARITDVLRRSGVLSESKTATGVKPANAVAAR